MPFIMKLDGEISLEEANKIWDYIIQREQKERKEQEKEKEQKKKS